MASRPARSAAADDRRPARVRGRRARPRGDRRRRRRPGPLSPGRAAPRSPRSPISASPTLATDAVSAIPFRVVTGAALACVYPVAIRLLAGWFGRERGVAVGVLVGALTIGSALPYLFRAVGRAGWRGLAPGRGRGQRRRAGRRAHRARRCPRRTERRPGAAVQPRHGDAGVRHRLGPTGEPRLSRAHVGALRDVDLGAAVHRGELRGGRAGGRLAGESRCVRGGRRRRGRVRRRPGCSPIGSAARR